jgi:Fe-S cluster biogenesis protein NfuA
MADPRPAPAGLPDQEVRERVARLDDLLERLEHLPGPGTDVAMEALEALTEVYGTALARVVASVDEATRRSLADDEVVGHLLLLHGLHPDPPEERIARALDEVRPGLGDGGDVELTGIDDGVATIRLTTGGCRSTAARTAAAVRDVVLDAAPELADVAPVTARPPAAPALIPVDALLRRPVAR